MDEDTDYDFYKTQLSYYQNKEKDIKNRYIKAQTEMDFYLRKLNYLEERIDDIKSKLNVSAYSAESLKED